MSVKKIASENTSHKTGKFFRNLMIYSLLGATLASSITTLVLQLQEESHPQIILGDSITITSKNADYISKQVQKRIDHTYVPRLANFNATDITVGEANYNLNFNDGSQVY
jgi:hypothetical protein